MPRYFFDLFDDMVVIDNVGLELPDLDRARREAISAIAGVAQDILPGDGPAKTLRVNVRDESGSVVITAEISFAVRYGG
jgi:hypothetical protein